MTPGVARAVKIYVDESGDEPQHDDEPNLLKPAEGAPVSHAQLIRVSQFLLSKTKDLKLLQGENGAAIPIHLNELLKGCSIYTPPSPPKSEPV